jgi:hypothetical protein
MNGENTNNKIILNETDNQRTQIRQLKKLRNAIISNSGTLPAGAATLAEQQVQTSELITLNSNVLSLLNNLIASQDVEILLVRDTVTGIVYQQIREYDQGTGVWNTRYEDVNGNPFTPVNILEYLDPSAVLNLMLVELQSIESNTSDNATETTLLVTNTLLTTIDNILDSIKLDTSNLDVPLSTRATEATLIEVRDYILKTPSKYFIVFNSVPNLDVLSDFEFTYYDNLGALQSYSDGGDLTNNSPYADINALVNEMNNLSSIPFQFAAPTTKDLQAINYPFAIEVIEGTLTPDLFSSIDQFDLDGETPDEDTLITFTPCITGFDRISDTVESFKIQNDFRLVAIQSELQNIALNTAKSDFEKLKTESDDLVQTISYLDAGDPVNRRVDTIVYSSASLALSVTETFGYAGAAGDYYVTSITLT